MEKELEELFKEGYKNDYNEVNYLISFIDKDVEEPNDEFDKLIYKINLILSKPSNSDYIPKLIQLVMEYNGNIKQIARIVFVLLNNQDIINKEKLMGNSFGLIILGDLLNTKEIDNDNKRIILEEYNYIYNTSLEISSIIQEEKLLQIPQQRNMIKVRGGKLYKFDKKKNKK